MDGLDISLVDELSDVRHALAFVRCSIPELPKEKLEPDVLSGCGLILNRIEKQVLTLEKALQEIIAQGKRN